MFAPWLVRGRWGKVPEQVLFLKLNEPLMLVSKKNSYTPEGRRCRKIKHTMRKLDHKYKCSQLFLFSQLGSGGLYSLNGPHPLEYGELNQETVTVLCRL